MFRTQLTSRKFLRRCRLHSRKFRRKFKKMKILEKIEKKLEEEVKNAERHIGCEFKE